MHEGVVEAHGPVGALLLRVQVIDLLLVSGLFIDYVFAATLLPAALSFLQATVHLGRPDRWLHSLVKKDGMGAVSTV